MLRSRIVWTGRVPGDAIEFVIGDVAEPIAEGQSKALNEKADLMRFRQAFAISYNPLPNRLKKIPSPHRTRGEWQCIGRRVGRLRGRASQRQGERVPCRLFQMRGCPVTRA